MEQAHADNVIMMPQQADGWSKLVRKLRWIGLQEEAAPLNSPYAIYQSSKGAWPQPVRSTPISK